MNIRKHPDVVQFQQAADRYCRLFESTPASPKGWLAEVLPAVARLYVCGHALPAFDLVDDVPDLAESFRVGDDEWQRVFDLVQDVMSELDLDAYYWVSDLSKPFDSSQEPMVGDLRDDLADIYRDIKPGLRAWDTGMKSYLPDIAFGWKINFDLHWGPHAVDAMRVLHELVFADNDEGSGRVVDK